MKIKSLVITLFIVCTYSSYSQNTERIIEEIAQQRDQSDDLLPLYELLERYKRKPLNLNTIQFSDLADFPFIRYDQLHQLITYRNLHGNLLSIYEIQYIDGFDEQTVKRILPFVTVIPVDESVFQFSSDIKYIQSKILARSSRVIEQNNNYLGNDWQHQIKVRVASVNHLEAGITLEKDAGELYWTKPGGIDYLSAYVEIRNVKWIKKLVLGDYNFKFGQGIAIQSGFKLGKGSDVLNIPLFGQQLTRYSSGEGLFFRGIATTLTLSKNVECSLFGSFRKLDAQVKLQDPENENMYISSISTLGKHRTANEISKRNAISHFAEGISLSYTRRKTKVELLSSFIGFEYPYKNAKIHKHHSFSIQRSYTKGFAFGEVATDANENFAFAAGTTLNLHSRFNLAVAYRNYSPSYFSFYSKSFSEGSEVRNEKGFYVGAELLPFNKWKCSLYFDRWIHPHPTHFIHYPHSRGYEFYTQCTFTPNTNNSLFFRYKREIKDSETKTPYSGSNMQSSKGKQSFRFRFQHLVNEYITLNTRIEYNLAKYQESVYHGSLFLQDVILKHKKFNYYIRYAYYNAESNDNRFYVYENDLLYSFAISSYTGNASRYYFMARYSATPRLSFWLKWSQSHFHLSEYKNEVKTQLQWKF